MLKCLLIIPYFGKFPNYFQLFLNSCKNLEYFDFLIFTDDKRDFIYPKNVKREICDFKLVKNLASEKIDHRIILDRPQKLCDFKPTYGLLFEDYLVGYNYWGHCDIDMLFGNLDKLVYPILAEGNFDKIFNLGHLTIYKNTKKNNRIFMNEIKEKGSESALFSRELCKFDEENHHNAVINYFKQENLNIYSTQLEADIVTKASRLLIDEYDFENNRHKPIKGRNLFIFDNGNVIGFHKVNGNVIKKEYAYIHLQKRKMDIYLDDLFITRYIIAANRFYTTNELDIEHMSLAKFNSIKTYFFNMHYLKLRTKNLIFKFKKYTKIN